MSVWPEVTTVIKESRKELVISGSDGNTLKRIEESGLDARIFKLNINLLEITKCKLVEVPSQIGEMNHLLSLLLHNNLLTSVPDTVNSLSKLTLLDLSFNQLETLPSLDKLVSLDTLNVSSNKLTSLPDLTCLTNLHVVIAGSNCLTKFPPGVLSEQLGVLHTLLFADNQIEDLPAKISVLKSLKTLDLSNNKVRIVPSELSLCLKLKDLTIRGNKLQDHRLQKIVDQLHTKHVTDYLTQIYEKEEETRKEQEKIRRKMEATALRENIAPKDGEQVVDKIDEPLNVEPPRDGKIDVKIIHFDAGMKAVIDQKENVLPIRPCILACIIRNLDLKRTTNMFKRFIALQNNLHDGICDKRQAATIATHDLNTCFFPMSYEARPAATLEITPLFAQNQKPVSAKQIVENLVQEAEELRKKNKRNTWSGIHKYIGLVRGAQNYSCIIDSQGTVISFPPITNALKTKCLAETRDVLLEVTSKSTDIGRRVMLALINEIATLVSNPAPENGAKVELTIEQVRVHDAKGQLKVVYPSQADLRDESRFNVTFVYPENKKGG